METVAMKDFWNGRKVLVTGHTGFKGTWLCLWLEKLGADVTGIALPPETTPAFHTLAGPWKNQHHHAADIRNAGTLRDIVCASQPEIVFHLAAQALVRRSYEQPAATYETNVMGTVNLLEAVRQAGSVSTVLVATSDKVYRNDDSGRAFLESDILGGKDPYSNSKACTELLCQSYRDSFLNSNGIALATARSGNVIGGGDWSQDRLVPDIMRAYANGEAVSLRYPGSTRPWQHVLEPLLGYLTLAQALAERRPDLPTAINFGPSPDTVASVSRLAEELSAIWGVQSAWVKAEGTHPAEAALLALNSDMALKTLGWHPRLDLDRTIDWTCNWYKAWRQGSDLRKFSLGQISEYEGLLQ